MSEQEIKTLQGQITELSEDIRILQATVQPIADIYITVSKLGKWIAVLVGFLATLLAIAIGIKNLITHK